jgi:hypothetical protein
VQFDELVKVDAAGYIGGGLIERQRRRDLLGGGWTFLVVGHS